MTGKSREGIIRGWSKHQVLGSNGNLVGQGHSAVATDTPKWLHTLKARGQDSEPRMASHIYLKHLPLGEDTGNLPQGPDQIASEETLTQRTKQSLRTGFKYFRHKNCDCLRRWLCLIFFICYTVFTYIRALHGTLGVCTLFMFLCQIKINLR